MSGLMKDAIVMGNGDGTFKQPTEFAIVAQPFALVAADFRGIGKLDLAVGPYAGKGIVVMLGNGDGTFQAPVEYTTSKNPFNIGDLVAGDFNGDGKLDLAAANFSQNTVGVLLNKGNGTFVVSAEYGT